MKFLPLALVSLMASGLSYADCTEGMNKIMRLKQFGDISHPLANINQVMNDDTMTLNKRPNGKDGANSETIKIQLLKEDRVHIKYSRKNTLNNLSSLENSDYTYNLLFNSKCELEKAEIDFMGSISTTLSSNYCIEILADAAEIDHRESVEKRVLKEAKLEICNNFKFPQEESTPKVERIKRSSATAQ